EGHGETRQPGEHMGGVDAISWSIVLRSDRFTKRTVNVKSSRKCSPLARVNANTIDKQSGPTQGGRHAMEPMLLKAGDVAKLLGLGRSKVFAMLAVGELPVIRIGRSVRVPRAALEDWIAEHTQHAGGRSGDAGPLFVGME